MAVRIDIKLEGAEALADQLRGLDEKLRKRAYRAALREGAQVVLDDMQARVPVREGTLKASLKKKVKVSERAHKAEVGWGGDGWYGHFTEYGTVYQPAQPFARPALEENTDAVVGAYEKAIQKVLDGVK